MVVTAKQEYWVSLDLKNNQLLNAKVEVLTSLPAAGNEGRVVYCNKKFYYDEGTKFVEVADASVVATNVSEISALKTTVGDASSGLVKDVNDLKETVGAGGEGDSLVDKVNSIKEALGSVSDTADKATAFGKAAAAAAAAAAAQSTADTAKTNAATAQGTADANKAALDLLTPRVKGVEDRATTLEGLVGEKGDTADATGSAFAKINKITNDITALTTTVGNNKTELQGKIDDKVDKVEGYGLSKNDFTDDFKTKLTGIEAGAQVNTVVDVTVNGTTVVGADKIAKINLEPYAKKTDITSAYIYKGTVADLDELNTKVTGATTGDVWNVEAQFTYNSKVYPEGTNVAWNGSAWDPLGGTVDLSPYATTEDVTKELAKKQNNLSEAQLAAANSGITAAKVTAYEGYDARITTAQSTANSAKTTAEAAVVANGAIARGTKCKITYDSKGLVTEGADLAVSDIPSGIPISKITGVLPYAQSPIMAAQYDVSATGGTSLPISTGMTTALVAQAVTTAGVVVGCAIQISGPTVTLTFSENFTGKVNVIGLRE
ncbi:MAG: hypothetical protein ACI38Y_05540 [Candidatus Methanomethylophilaceae archaeon]